MERVRILYVITSLGFGGAEKLLLTYLKLLDHSKYEFFVCCLREKPDDLLEEISKYAVVTNFRAKSRYNLFAVLNLIKLFRSVKPHIIHTHLFQARFYSTVAHIFYNRSILITHKHNNVNLNKHNVFILLEMISIFFNEKVIAISESVKQSLRKYELVPSRKIFLLKNGVDYQKFYGTTNSILQSDKNPIIIGNVGRLEKQKGISYLLLAMNIILTKFPNVQLEIIGDGSLLGELKELSEKLGISNSVKFFGKFADVIPFYRRMNIFILPSIYEGFGIVLLEAMAAGVPVVATNVDGIKEVVLDGESGILVPPKNPEAIANAVFEIIENPQLVESLVRNGYKRSELFDIKEHVMKLDNFYKNLLGVESYQ